MVGLTLLGWSKKGPRRYVWLGCFFLLVLMQAACTSSPWASSSSQGASSPQNYTITISGAAPTTASPTVRHSTQVTVTVP
jgi:hypothetical protein